MKSPQPTPEQWRPSCGEGPRAQIPKFRTAKPRNEKRRNRGRTDGWLLVARGCPVAAIDQTVAGSSATA
eukprot:scaffold29153_cov107-Isochrysis_galbana.AAC.8